MFCGAVRVERAPEMSNLARDNKVIWLDLVKRSKQGRIGSHGWFGLGGGKSRESEERVLALFFRQVFGYDDG